MPRKSKRHGTPATTRFVWALLMVAVVALGAMAGYVVLTPSPVKRGDNEAPLPVEKTAKQTEREVEVLTPRFVGRELRFEARSQTPPQGEDARVFAVNAFLDRVAAAPRQARATSCAVKDGLATVNFTAEFDQTYGTDDEQVIVNGVLTALGQFPDIQTALFQVEGRPLETLGNIDLTEAQAVIRPTAEHVTRRSAPNR